MGQKPHTGERNEVMQRSQEQSSDHLLRTHAGVITRDDIGHRHLVAKHVSFEVCLADRSQFLLSVPVHASSLVPWLLLCVLKNAQPHGLWPGDPFSAASGSQLKLVVWHFESP